MPQALRSGAVIADGFDRAAFHGFLAELLFIGRFRLLVDVGVTAVIIAAKIARSGFAAEIAVDALIIDVKFAGQVFGIAISDVSHNIWSKSAYTAPHKAQQYFSLFIKGFAACPPWLQPVNLRFLPPPLCGRDGWSINFPLPALA